MVVSRSGYFAPAVEKVAGSADFPLLPYALKRCFEAEDSATDGYNVGHAQALENSRSQRIQAD